MNNAKNLGWKKISQENIRINRFRWLKKVRYRTPAGDVDDFYLYGCPRVVAALVLTKDKKVVLVEQFRLGPERILLELPGGRIDAKETPRQAVSREVLEESGYRGTIRRTGKSSNDAWSTLERTHFVVTNAVRVGEPKFDKFEHGRVCLVSLREFRRLLRTGMMTDAETGYLGLDALRLL